MGTAPSDQVDNVFTGQRGTRQRRAIRDWLANNDSFTSAQQVRDGLSASGESVGLTTVYRTLQGMADVGEVDVIRTDSGEALYRKCGDTHHHHLTCRNCGVTIELAAQPVERWTSSIAREYGFDDVSHTVEISGLCPACQ